jgi:hypothetical protein
MLSDQELQCLRNMGNEAEAAADEIERLRASVGVVVRAAVHHAVEACAAATGQHRVIAHFVNKTHIANEVLAAVSSVAADARA